MGAIRRFLNRLAESDEERLAAEIREWAEHIPGTVRIADAKPRQRVKLAGVVKRITISPMRGNESVEARLSDGTGEVRVVWMGRRTIPGLKLGTRLIVEGVLAEDQSGRRLVNPVFEFGV
jgi:RecG-like helicase